MNNFLVMLAVAAYISFFIFVIKLIAYFLHKWKINRLEPYKREIEGITYYELFKGNEISVIGNEHKMVRSQLEKISSLYQSKVISFREGLSITSSEYAHSIGGVIKFTTTRTLSKEEDYELTSRKKK